MRNPLVAKFFLDPHKARKPEQKRQRKDHESHAEHRRKEALEAERRRFSKYIEARAQRLHKLRAKHPQVDRYIKLLDRLTPDTIAYSRRDCDQDLAPVVTRLGLADLLDPYSRFTLLEYTLAWLGDLARAQRVYSFDDEDIFGSPHPTTIDDLKAALALH